MTNLQPSDLTAEERAIVDHEASRFHRDWTAEARYKTAFDICKSFILARRALFAPAKVECPECGGFNGEHHNRLDFITCFRPDTQTKPALPSEMPECPECHRVTYHLFDCSLDTDEPAPPSEMPCPFCGTQPEVKASDPNGRSEWIPEGSGLGSAGWIGPVMEASCRTCGVMRVPLAIWNNRSQPAPALRMTPELRHVLEAARESADVDENEFPDRPWAKQTRAAITAVIAQASQPQRVAEDSDRTTYLEELAREESMYCAVLPKVREALIALSGCVNDRVNMDKVIAALAELDAMEGVKG